MKKLFLLSTVVFLSCSVKQEYKKPSLQEKRYIIRESKKVGTLIKRDLNKKKAVVLCYPTYVKESYQLIKYLAAIMNEYDFDGVYLQDSPVITNIESIKYDLQTQSPHLAFEEFIDLYTYLDKNGIKLLNSLEPTENKILILAPEEIFEDVRYTTFRNISKKHIIFMSVAGIEESRNVISAINEIPYGKRVGSITLKNSVYSDLSSQFYGLIMMGLPSSYSPVTPIELYNENNYLTAPTRYLDQNKSIIKSIQVEKMNNYLPKQIYKTIDNLNINHNDEEKQ